jgi:hypothetical protein
MQNKIFNLVILFLTLSVTSVAANAGEDSTSSQEYQIKAAFLYNFLKFVDWPQEKTSDTNESIVIGIIGSAPLEDAFKPIEGKTHEDVHGKTVVVKYFKSFEELKKSGENSKDNPQKELEALRKCHLLFICSSEQKSLSQILDAVKDSYVLTVGEEADFLPSGGIINFVVEDEKMRFEINVAAADKAQLKIRSQLLRLAKKVVDDDSAAKSKPKSSGKVMN